MNFLDEFSSFVLASFRLFAPRFKIAKSKVEDFFGAFILWLCIPYVQDNALQAIWNVTNRRRLIR